MKNKIWMWSAVCVLVAVAWLMMWAGAAFGAVTVGPGTGGTGTGTVDPNTLTNNHSVPVNFAAQPFTVTPGGGFQPLSFGGLGGVGMFNAGDLMVLKGAGYRFNGKDNTAGFGSVDAAGNMFWGGVNPGGVNNNNNFFYAPYQVGSLGMSTNRNMGYDISGRAYPVPLLCFNSYYDMLLAPNGTWATNTIALATVVAPGWAKTGWTNIWYNGGHLTNRVPGVNGHLTNNSAAFPQGITGIVTYGHSQGFCVGTYIAHAQAYCTPLPGQATTDDLIYQDIYDIGAMGFDLLTVDLCGTATPYQGLRYDPGEGTYLMRHAYIIPWANVWMSYTLGRKPLYMGTTEIFSPTIGVGAWHQHYTSEGYNYFEDASPPGDSAKWQGCLTNWLFEQVNYQEIRPGHLVRHSAGQGTTAADSRGTMALWVLAPSTIFLGGTNFIGNAAASPFYTNTLVNQGILQHPLVRPGFEVISNGVNKVVVIARPLGPPNNIPTTSSSFNAGPFPTGLGGFITYGTDSTNAVGVFNLDTAPHTQVISVTNIGIGSNVLTMAWDVWNNANLGMFTDQFTTPSIPASDSALYLFIPVNPIATQVANYAVRATDNTVLLSGNFTATLPTAVGIPGKAFTIVCKSAGTNGILATGGQTFLGYGSTAAASWTNSVVGRSTTVVSDGTNWVVVKSDN